MQQLASIHKLFQVDIVISELVAKRIGIQDFSAKYLGKLRVRDNQFEDLYALVSDSDKSDAAEFSKAMTAFYETEYEKSCALFVQLQQDPSAKFYAHLCKQLSAQIQLQVAHFSIDQCLTDAVMKNALQQFCTSELSTENIQCYNAIHDFQKEGNDAQRKTMAMVMFIYKL